MNEKRRSFLHVGHGKTGSSALQDFLEVNAPLLEEFGLSYPTGRGGEAGKLGMSGNGMLFLDVDDLNGGEIFSSELLFKDEYIDEKSVLISKLMQFRDSLTVIIYTRDVYDHFVSSWGQSIKRGGESHNIAQFAKKYRNFRKLRTFLEILSKRDIDFVIKNYSRTGGIEASFMSLVLPENRDAFMARATLATSKVNRSLTLAELELQRHMNKIFGNKPSGRISELFEKRLPDLPSDKLTVPQSAISVIQRSNSDAIAKINQYLNADDRLSLDPDPSIILDVEQTDYVFSAEHLEAIARFCSNKVQRES